MNDYKCEMVKLDSASLAWLAKYEADCVTNDYQWEVITPSYKAAIASFEASLAAQELAQAQALKGYSMLSKIFVGAMLVIASLSLFGLCC